ncbi:hypothetical protein SAMN04488056_11576 [Cohaesibacter marisflavi]|uniref:Alpha/beta hydrolase family protein n=1 Tax=Cohaesibacter marisflavi TaxID=655353 RepID=A0A1I5KZN5_9HYPH|nr:hypothetical protein [Cohaesibacter marisflavi]SFO90544.1 hypothetical protein SAMN04488056_11576 [Cohaesibacter marisflavi]
MRLLSNDGLYAADIFIQNDGPIVFAFDNMNSAGPIENRVGWGFDFIRSKDINVISFLETRSTAWYRRTSFFHFLDEIDRAFNFNQFSSRISYGGSMGGYAAGAFASRLNCDSAILLNPISTLNKQLAPWEPRYPKAKKENWESSFHDASEGIIGVSKVFLVADPLLAPDRKHIHRFFQASPRCEFYRIPGVGHGMPRHMHSLGVLKPFVLDILKGNIPDKVAFSAAVRNRRDYLGYYQGIFSNESLHRTPMRTKTLSKNLAKVLNSDQVPKPQAKKMFARMTGKNPSRFGL